MKPMRGFTSHTGKIVVMPGDQVDTDRIIPARFLTRVTRSGYGDLLFADVRGADCPLDQPEAQGATFMVVGSNFGCGSSREHAVWAIMQAGFRAVIAKVTPDSSGYSDIFRQNSANCGLLLIELPQTEHEKLAALGSGAEIHVDLPDQTIKSAAGEVPFEIKPATKQAVLEGLDLIGATEKHMPEIEAYETHSSSYIPR